MQPNTLSFETALEARVEEMLDACTRCGKCVEACPSVKPAGIADATPEDIITGIIDIVRNGMAPTPRANGRSPACSAASASGRATRVSIRASCWRWRASP